MRTLSKFLMRAIRFIQDVSESILIGVLAVVVVVAGSWFYPDQFIWLMDANLALLKEITGWFGPEWGKRIEGALRMGLGIDKMLMVVEITAVIKMIPHFVKWLAIFIWNLCRKGVRGGLRKAQQGITQCVTSRQSA